ncbi:b04f0f84-d757-4464-9571-82ab1f03401a [Sclerotinia trifoliorum]|uniref:B04f0f84-d757-4464-9571-82ab1f03401a n=1 Tax=Sclerotinia trifoliorum TaxID=28548 RepID=A0A8H2VT34_9HELO|nr:b04f0f84-d757-4464-9571-82ab1f03401a [Sclerotinia trifoliorum]
MPDWSLEEDVVLFAWLDFYNKHGGDHLATIKQKIMEATGKCRTKNAVRCRLRFIEWKYRQLQVQVPARKSTPVKTRIVPASKTTQQAQDEASHVRKRSSQEAGEDIARKKRRLEETTGTTPLEKQDKKSEMGLPRPFSTAERPKSHLPKAKSPAKAAVSNVHKEPKISLSSKAHSENRSNDEVVKLGHRKHVKEKSLENIKESYRRDLQRKEAEIIAIRDHWDSDLLELHGRIGKLQQTKLELESKASNLEAADIVTIDTAMNEIRLELEAMTEIQDFRRMHRPKEWFDGNLTHLVNSAFTSLEGSNHGGWVELRLFDVGAFKEHMKQPYFKDLLKRTTKQLSCRLSRTLSPLFGKGLENLGHDFSFHTWGEESESWKERQYHFERLSGTALELKSGSVITDDNYTFEFSSNQAYSNKPFDEPDVPEGSCPSHKMQIMLQPKGDLVEISATSDTDNEDSEQNILHPAETHVSEATHKSRPAVIEIPIQSKRILQLPAQAPDMPSKYKPKHHTWQFEKSNSSLSVTRGRERAPSAVSSAPKRITRSNPPTERESSEDTDLDANFTNSSEAVENREPDSPRATHDYISSAGEDTQTLDNEISDSFDSNDDGELEVRNSPLHLASMIGTNDPNLSNVGRGSSSTKGLDTTSEGSEIKELAIAKKNHKTKNIRKSSYELGENAVILSEELRYGSNLKMDMRLCSSFGVSQESLEVNLKENATLSPNDVELGNQEILFPEKSCSTGKCGTTDDVFESPRLIPERRKSQLYLVGIEEEESEESEADEDHSVVVKDSENINAERAEQADTPEDESTEADENEDDEMDENQSIEAGHDDNFQMKGDEEHSVDNEDAVKLYDNDDIEDDICENCEADNDGNGGVAGEEATEANKDNCDELIGKATSETENSDNDEDKINRHFDVENEEDVENHDNGILERWINSCEGPMDETVEVERDETIEFDDNRYSQARVEEDFTTNESTDSYDDKTKVVENDDNIEATGKGATEVETKKGIDVDSNRILEDSGLIFDVPISTPAETGNRDNIQLGGEGKLQATEIRKKEVAVDEDIEVQGNKITEAEDEENIEVDIGECFQVRGADKDITMDDGAEGICGHDTAASEQEVENDDSIEDDYKMNCQECEVQEKVVHDSLIIMAERPKCGPESEAEQEVVDLNESMEIDSNNTAGSENGDSKMSLQDEEFHNNQTSVADNDSNIDADYLNYSPAREVGWDTTDNDIEVNSNETAEAENGESISTIDKPIYKQEEHQNSEIIPSGDEFQTPFSDLTGVQEPRSKFGNEGVSAGSFPWNILKNPSIFSLRKAQQQQQQQQHTENRLKMQSEENRDMEVQEEEDEVQGVSTEFADY